MGIYLPGTGTLGCMVSPGAGIARFQGIPPDFLSTIHECGVVHSAAATASPCHTASLGLSAQLHDSASPTHLDECGFFKSLVVRLPYSLNLCQFCALFVLGSSCNSFHGCMKR